MLFSDSAGWTEVDRSHHDHRWFLSRLVMPMSLLPPALYAYAEMVHPGAIFPLSVPAITPLQLLGSGAVFYLAQLLMVSYMAMLIQRMSIARDHDPGYDGAYALAAIAPMPLWIGSLAMLVPSLSFNVAIAGLALLASIALVRHGVRPLLHISDEKIAHYISNMVTMAAVAAWIVLMIMAAMILSIFFGVAAAM
jgi:hypothetical protein